MDSLYCTFTREIEKDGVKHEDKRTLAFYPKFRMWHQEYDRISPKEAAEKLRKFADTIEALEE